MRGLECQDKGLNLPLWAMGSHRRPNKQRSDLFAFSRVLGVLWVPHTPIGRRLEPFLSLPHSSSFQERVWEILMNSLLIPLSGESNCGGRAGGGLLLLRPSCCHLISSPVPGRSSPNLFGLGPLLLLLPIPRFAAF